MSEMTVEQRLVSIEEHLSAIRGEMDSNRKQRESMDDLKDDLTRVAHDAFSTAVVEMEDIAPFVNTGDFWHLLKHLLRNTRMITDSLAKAESALDFTEDLIPIGHEMFTDLMIKLDEFDRKGYFELLKALSDTMDEVVETTSPEDLAKITDRVVTPGLELLKKLADMDFVSALSRTVDAYNEHGSQDFDSFGTFNALRSTRKTEMRRAMGRTTFFLETLARETNKQNGKQA
jgi:uncharacterized protein YjgD (DUF1641 family)